MFRYEQKYIINRYKYEEIRPVIGTLVKPDEHNLLNGEYSIRSLYFDDYRNSAYWEKQDGVYKRKKYRIRIYNYSDKSINMECKIKEGQYIKKEAFRITADEYEDLINGGGSFLLKKDEALAKELYVDLKTRLLRPSVIVDYEREAYVSEAGNVRITFDKDVRAVDCRNSIFDKNAAAYSVLLPESLIMEIKFTGYIPEKIRQIFKVRNFTQTQASKFCMCVERLNKIL